MTGAGSAGGEGPTAGGAAAEASTDCLLTPMGVIVPLVVVEE